MTKSKGNGEGAINCCKHSQFLFLLILFLSFILMSCQAAEIPEYKQIRELDSIENPISEMFESDAVVSFLGKGFDEIRHALGEPDEQGYSDWLGPHYYILYRYKEGDIQFCSPEPIDNEIAVSIILGPGQEVLGVKVGMRFPEITEILGEPDFGPEIGMDNLYYMGYFGGEINDQLPEFLISFVAISINSYTDHVFINWVAFEYEQTEIVQAAR